MRPFPGPGGARLVSVAGGISPIWAHNGREIFYVSADDSWVIATVRTDPDFAVESRDPFASAQQYGAERIIQRFDVAPDDRRLLAIRVLEDAEFRHVVILNWAEELRRLVPN